MKYTVKGKPGGGRAKNWEPDADSQELLDHYVKKRLKRRLSPATIKGEISLLRSFVFASLSLGGPRTLRKLREDPRTIARIVRGEWDRTSATLASMLSAMLNLIELTVTDEDERRRLRGEITANLYVKPLQDRRWNRLPAEVGGSQEPFDHGPILSAADLTQLVEGAGAGAGEFVALRSRAIVALGCWSSISTGEMKSLCWEQLKWLDETEAPMWCAEVSGIRRRRRVVRVPVLREAEAPMRALQAQLGSTAGSVFKTASGERAVSYWTIQQTFLKAFGNAGIGDCDDLAVKRAFSAVLESRGLDEYEVRDALGVRSMITVEGRLRQHRSAMAARLAEEHRVLPQARLSSSPADRQFELLPRTLDE